MKKLNSMLTIIAVTTGLLLIGGCKNEQSTTSGAPAASQSSTSQQNEHAPASVTPGSYEDWCEEHQVPESQCAQCNPKLIAAFKATGDWCNEHGLPESQCRLCNPELKIQRPPKPQGAK